MGERGRGGLDRQARAIIAAVYCGRGSDVFSRYFDDGPLPPLFHHHQHQQQQHLLFLAGEAFLPSSTPCCTQTSGSRATLAL